MLARLEKLVNALTGIEYIIVVPLFLIMLGVMFVQVIFRYYLEIPLSFSEELARFLFVACTFLGAAIATAERGHIEINFTEMTIARFAKSQSAKMRTGIIMNVLRDMGTIVCLSLVSWQAFSLTMDQYMMKSVSTAMSFPYWILTAIMLVGLLLEIFA
mgnify:CR=1 FL=1